MKKNGTIWLLIVLFALPLSAFALLNWYESRFARLPVLGPSSNNQAHRIADFSLTNQDNETVTLAKWDNKITVACFFFSHCPVVCPKMITNMKKVALHNRGGFIRLASITVDPERDNPGVLKNYAQRMKIETGNWDLLTGTKKDIYRMARNSFLAVATDGDGGPEDFIHSEKLVLIDKQKRIRGFYTGTSDQEVKQLIIDIKKLLHEN